MKQIERIRQMSAEEFAKWLMIVVQKLNFSLQYCKERFCPFDEDPYCTDEKCLKAVVAYLESEVSEK